MCIFVSSDSVINSIREESMKKYLLIWLLLFGALATMTAAEDTLRISSVEHRFKLSYLRDGIDIDETYLDNEAQIAYIRHYLAKSPRIDSVTIYSWASPEGVYRRNVWLSEERAAAAKRFLIENAPEGSSLKAENIILKPMHENWEGLLKAVEETYFRHDREKVLAILRDTTVRNDTKKWRLQQLDNGYTYNFLIRHQMPRLRVASWVCIWAPTLEQLPLVSEPKDDLDAPQTFPGPLLIPAKPVRIPIFSLRTNLLVPALNIGAELPLGDRWSLAADYYFPWCWPNKKNKDCFELLGWSVEGRYWFGRDRKPHDRLKGHSIGVYAAGGYYDFEKDYRGMQGEFISPGIDYTYSMAIGRKRNLHLQFTLAVGYIRSWGRTYNVYEPYGELFPDEGTLIWNYFGPTKAAVSLVLPFYKKEGRR